MGNHERNRHDTDNVNDCQSGGGCRRYSHDHNQRTDQQSVEYEYSS